MTYRAVTAAMRAHGCTAQQGKGDHEKWTCPCGSHMTVITQTRELSPGLIRQAIARLECLPKGWLL
ncbi:type II toxin-antitoxin system HicA family toxin [Nocardioides marmorisolisilvae]|uniref:Type II toxin-antitoxin system HicA family toxin n=1 Tax=Nocardioides marmorisolisilvae TaxID=1542737 RepID=A0A3N0E0X8_9ACTN|nr:type II toxin-antitoxin system HicA family toxin [Nocardioides marmorisolisilvae]